MADLSRGPDKENEYTGKLASKLWIITGQFWKLLAETLIKNVFKIDLFFLVSKFVKIGI